jgi:O-acetyl-ADP-ribose deacetylase (regulator of RNase III)
LDHGAGLGGGATGAAKITAGYTLPAKYVIHTVGPIWRGGQAQESALLASCYRESLKIAEEKGLMTVAFPAISCGVYGFPIPEACTIAMNTVYSYLLTAPSLRKIIFACFNDLVKKELERALRERVADTIR